MLAADDIVLQINGEALWLRPSLRAAVRLERRFAGFSGLLQAIGEGSVTAVLALAVECGEHRFEAVILAPSAETWADRFERITPALVRLVFDIAEIEPVDPERPRITFDRPAVTMTLGEAYTQLFSIATGALGWSAAQAWATPPVEIRRALETYLAVFRASHGIAEPDDVSGYDAAPLDSVGLASLAGMADAA